MTRVTRRTPTCATCRIEHTCTLSLVSSFDHSSHNTWLKAVQASFTPSPYHPRCAVVFELSLFSLYFFLLFHFLFLSFFLMYVEQKSQFKACLKHSNAGIMYCTYGHLMTDDSAENKKYISAVLDLFSIPNFYIRKGRPHGHKYGKAPGCKEYFTANQLAKRCRKKKYESIHDRFIRDKTFKKAMIELGRSEKIIIEMDQLASENHSRNHQSRN